VICRLLFSFIPLILLILHFKHASWPVRLPLVLSLLLLKFCPLCVDVSKSRFTDLSTSTLLTLPRFLFGVLVRM